MLIWVFEDIIFNSIFSNKGILVVSAWHSHNLKEDNKQVPSWENIGDWHFIDSISKILYTALLVGLTSTLNDEIDFSFLFNWITVGIIVPECMHKVWIDFLINN